MTHPLKGFTLVETLVAITVLVTAIVGPLYAVHKSVTASYTARDILIATALAQEGVEYVRFVRDSNYLEGNTDWLDGLAACQAATGCALDSYAQSIQACPSEAGGGCPALNLDTASRYVLGSGTATRFRRTVALQTVSNTEARVTVTVSWETLRTPYTVTVTEELYNWQ